LRIKFSIICCRTALVWLEVSFDTISAVMSTVHADMLRHGCGYALANAGHDTRRIQDWLGHRSIAHTTRYTQLSAVPFKDFWR
jgi:site-specific recombinase XerD